MKNVLKLALLIMFVAVLPLLPARAEDSFARWKYEKPVTAGQDSLTILQLDRTILQHARQDLYDVRLVDASGQTVPYQVVRAKAQFDDTLVADLIDRGIIGNEYVTVTLDMHRSSLLHNRVTLDVYAKNDYLREVTIEGSNDNLNWTYIGKGKILSLTPKYYKDYLEYPTSSQRYLRLKIPIQGEKPLEVLGAEVFFKAVEPIKPVLLQTLQMPTVVDDKLQTTSYILDLGVKGLDIHHVMPIIEDKNYDRTVELYASNNQKDWHPLSSGRIFHYNWPNYEALDNKLMVYSTGGRYLKLVVHDQDSPSLSVQTIEVWGGTPRLLADLRKGDYVLRYGNPDAMQPNYDLTKFSAKIDIGQLPVIQPEAETANADYSKNLTERFPWLLNTVVILAALALGLIIFRNMKGEKSE